MIKRQHGILGMYMDFGRGQYNRNSKINNTDNVMSILRKVEYIITHRKETI
jgi:hypothetical protein